jgi:hypothetical protein
MNAHQVHNVDPAADHMERTTKPPVIGCRSRSLGTARDLAIVLIPEHDGADRGPQCSDHPA